MGRRRGRAASSYFHPLDSSPEGGAASELMGISGVGQPRLAIILPPALRRDLGETVYGRLPRPTHSHPPPGFRARQIELDGEVFVIGSYPVAAEREGAALTGAERAVAEGAASGKSNAEMARERGTSARTVANLLSRAFAKLGVGSRIELAARWGRL